MEAEKIVKDLMETLKAVSDTQSTQTRVIDRLSDGLLRAVNVIGELKTRVEILEVQVKSHCEGGM